VPVVREMITPEQRRKLPQLVVNMLDPRYLVSIRNGTGMYVSGSGFSNLGGGAIGFAPGAFVEFSAVSAVIR
jgi:hypothetical protein